MTLRIITISDSESDKVVEYAMWDPDAPSDWRQIEQWARDKDMYTSWVAQQAQDRNNRDHYMTFSFGLGELVHNDDAVARAMRFFFVKPLKVEEVRRKIRDEAVKWDGTSENAMQIVGWLADRDIDSYYDPIRELLVINARVVQEYNPDTYVIHAANPSAWIVYGTKTATARTYGDEAFHENYEVV